MVYDSIANASIPTAASNSKDFGKKKRVNRSAKLKQSKLDVRREQWLSQVKNKGLGTVAKEEAKMRVPDVHAVKERECERERDMVKLEISVGENEGGYSDSESLSNSPTSHTSSVSVANFTGSSSGCGSSSGSSSGSSGGCFSGNLTDEEDRRDHEVDHDDDDDCLDDWETLADALIADDDLQKNHDTESDVRETVPEPEPEPELTTRAGQGGNRASGGLRAWRPDDVSRPQSLPNLLKQNSFPMNSGMHMHHRVGFAPSACPICCEDLDMTDSSFLPCPCGYRLCLFCHKRILEDNGRCPGCRQKYEQPDQGTAPAKLARCYSMNPKLQK